MFLLNTVKTMAFAGLAGFHLRAAPALQCLKMDSHSPVAYRREKALKKPH